MGRECELVGKKEGSRAEELVVVCVFATHRYT
jgi:hypothetical protein